MAQLRATTTLHVEPDTLWRDIGHFGDVGKWYPSLENLESDGEFVGARRVFETKFAGEQTERLQALDPETRRYSYVIESTGLPVTHCTAELRVDDNGDGSSTLVWSAEFDAHGDDSAVEMLERFFEDGVAGLRKRYSADADAHAAAE